MNNGSEKYKFVQKQEKEIRPIADDQQALEDIAHEIPVPAERIQALIEQYETKIFISTYAGAHPHAGRLLLEAAQPANYKILHPLIESLKSDVQCAGVTLLTDNVAGKMFLADKDPAFQAAPSNDRPVIADIPKGPYRAALILPEGGENVPTSVLLYGAKSVFGAEKLCFLSLGLFDPGEKKLFSQPVPEHREDIDIIFSADAFSKQLFCGALDVPEEKVIVTGTPLLEGLRVEEEDTLRAQGRAALGIAEDTMTALYSGFPSADFRSFGGDPHLNLLTFEQTLTGVVAAAVAEPAKKFSLIVRIHPRARNVEPPLISTQQLPRNLTVVDGNGITYEEAVYATDIICCCASSTESLLAAYRGREAAVFAFPGKGQLGELLTENYGEKGEAIMRASDRMVVVDSPQKMSEMLLHHTPREALPVKPGSLERMKEIMLSP